MYIYEYFSKDFSHFLTCVSFVSNYDRNIIKAGMEGYIKT